MEGVDQRSGGGGGGGGGGTAFGGGAPRPPNQKPGIPPSHPNINVPPSTPYSQFSQRLRSPGSSSHSRSLSQPSIFSLDSLPPLSPSPAATSIFDTTDMSLDETLVVSSHAPSVPVNRGHALLPPRKGHRRSSSDSPLGISGFMQSSPPPPPLVPPAGESSGFEKPIQLVLKAPYRDGDRADQPAVARKEEAADDLFREYMNLDNIDSMNFPGVEDKDLDSRTSGSKTVESSDNEVESHGNGKTSGAHAASSSCSEERREGVKRSSNGDVAPGGRHRRSFSLDSSIGNFHIDDGLPKLHPLTIGQHSPSNSTDGKTSESTPELGNGEFSAEELKKIMESDKLAEIASSDPKRAKRILANRQSAARSKERKMRYIAELEHKVQTLQTETTTLSTQFTKLQRDNNDLKNENNEYKLRLQAMEQQSQLKDALNETLDAEVRRLRRTVAELGGESLTSCMARQLAINQQMFHLQQQQAPGQHRHFLLQNRHTQEESESRSQQIHANELHPQTQIRSQQIQRNELHPQP